ncbi:MAG: hemolysin family protein [Planctomycetota bacterium]
MWLLIVSVLGALIVSGLCSLMEATLLSFRPSQISELTTRSPRVASLWQRFLDDIERPIAAILILNTASHTIGASVAGAEFDRLYGDRWIWAFSFIFTCLMLQFTEILPKGLGVRHCRRVAFWIAWPLDLLVRLMGPIQVVVQWINRAMSGHASAPRPPAAAEEIVALSRFAALSGELSAEQEYIISRGAQLSSLSVRDAMRPRVDIDALDVETPPEEVVGAVAISGFSRLPVYEGDLDDIIGFVFIKDLMLAQHMGRTLELRTILRPPLLVPTSLRLDRLVARFRRERTQLAIVVDEYGGTSGLVTLEDALEKLVGDIHDEHRIDEQGIVRRDATSWLVSGSASLDDLLMQIGRPDLRPEIPSKISRLDGLVQKKLNRIAAVGDRVRLSDVDIEVVETDGPRIARVAVTVGRREADRPESG